MPIQTKAIANDYDRRMSASWSRILPEIDGSDQRMCYLFWFIFFYDRNTLYVKKNKNKASMCTACEECGFRQGAGGGVFNNIFDLTMGAPELRMILIFLYSFVLQVSVQINKRIVCAIMQYTNTS